jgi:hypothetical protein
MREITSSNEFSRDILKKDHQWLRLQKRITVGFDCKKIEMGFEAYLPRLFAVFPIHRLQQSKRYVEQLEGFLEFIH